MLLLKHQGHRVSRDNTNGLETKFITLEIFLIRTKRAPEPICCIKYLVGYRSFIVCRQLPIDVCSRIDSRQAVNLGP